MLVRYSTIEAVLQYLVTEVISLAGETANNARKFKIKPRHLQMVFQNHEELCELMIGEDNSIGKISFKNDQL